MNDVKFELYKRGIVISRNVWSDAEAATLYSRLSIPAATFTGSSNGFQAPVPAPLRSFSPGDPPLELIYENP